MTAVDASVTPGATTLSASVQSPPATTTTVAPATAPRAGMRLAWKLVVAIVVGLVTVLTMGGWLRVGREIEVFETDMRRDHEEVARVLEPSLQMAWRRGGTDEVLKVLGTQGKDQRLSLRWVDRESAGPPGEDRRTHVFPMAVDGERIGWMEVSERRDDENEFIEATVMRSAGVTVALSAIATLIVMVLTFVLVGRPVRRLREKTRRIAAGDLSGSLRISQRDEIGDLARDIDGMCEALAAAQLKAAQEGEARARAIEQLRHADRLASVGTLASGIAHELGTPLGVVLARARLLEEDDHLPPATTNSARVIAQQVERMSRIIRQVLDFSRSGGVSRPYAPDAVDLRALAREVASLVQPLADKRQVAVVVEEGSGDEALGNSGLLQQVLLNLVMNALHAMDRPGEVRIGVTAMKDAGGVGERCVRLWVHDQGPGIAPEIMPRIFEPFFTTKGIGEGTGLGLSVVWGIVREQGGRIEAANLPERGARFDVFLPAARA